MHLLRRDSLKKVDKNNPRAPPKPEPLCPALIYMRYVWSSRDTNHRAPYLFSDALIDLPRDTTPLHCFQRLKWIGSVRDGDLGDRRCARLIPYGWVGTEDLYRNIIVRSAQQPSSFTAANLRQHIPKLGIAAVDGEQLGFASLEVQADLRPDAESSSNVPDAANDPSRPMRSRGINLSRVKGKDKVRGDGPNADHSSRKRLDEEKMHDLGPGSEGSEFIVGKYLDLYNIFKKRALTRNEVDASVPDHMECLRNLEIVNFRRYPVGPQVFASRDDTGLRDRKCRQ
ncbi:hypothetical protein CC80DRAFT_543771 [Byssothecium circinans]|uniref:Uncharacterized protein n=1 Tax=Byssothecium circinans TaxID=147558 RepID=A0A6A5U9N5_9PLEO|nr:hypothetical protein CC80DRAFT_543771 [Byssothecium circinans]